MPAITNRIIFKKFVFMKKRFTQMGFAQSVKSSVTTCTLENLYAAMDSQTTAQICADIEDALENVKRGEMSREDFETFKREKKKELMVLTPHATFSDGHRSNDSAVPSGLSMYDVDHIPDPRGYFNNLVRDRCRELGIVMAHMTPSTEASALSSRFLRGWGLPRPRNGCRSS